MPDPPDRDPRYDAHLAPTLADVPLNPRRRLRDGTASASGSSRASSRSARGRKRTRSALSDSEMDTSANAEACRRLPVLHPRLPRQDDGAATSPDAGPSQPMDVNGDEFRSRSHPAPLASSLPEIEGSPASEQVEAQEDARGDVSSDDEPLGQRSRNSPSLVGRSLTNGLYGDLPNPGNTVDFDLLGLDSASTPNSNRSPSLSAASTTSGPRYTAREKGKGRAIQGSLIELSDDEDDVVDESIRFIEKRAAPPIDVTGDGEVDLEPPEAAIDEESAISAFTCPVCFMPPTAPALIPCGHVLCYGCLHQSMIAAIGRQPNPYARNFSGRRGGTKRKRSPFASLREGGRYIPPAKWTQETIEAAWAASQDDRHRRQLIRDGLQARDIEATLKLAGDGRDDSVKHTLQGLWNLGSNHWVIEGDCPVCRKPIPGGLGPLEYRLGSVVLLETRVARAGEPEILSLA
ncbi:hypothetical protein CspeluHIS016_0504070 [Cutaneotrichosporon spelunceum]|uniref:RING-type domain-containing protein n=1 Tax=Cutaneotrichosporon spelunceum TaxID=1672016 RepID=A0AAD3TXP0_9TREE|nr:hypothetical protein CspeluHIS016_0504070 [Cutaneotrichosporon spelunceum]